MFSNKHVKKYGLAIAVVGIASFIGLAQMLNIIDTSPETMMSDVYSDGEQLLYSLTRSQLQTAILPKVEALVAIIPKDGDIPTKIQQVLDEAGEYRSYPFEGGQKIVCPYVGQKYDSSLFSIEEDAWNHEHCDACYVTIATGDSCWVDFPENDYILCGDCYQKLKP